MSDQPAIVDTHPHVIAGDNVKYPIAPIGGIQSSWSVNFSFGPSELVAAMDEAGVAAATLVQASTVYGQDNSYVSDSIGLFPTRLAGVGGVDPQSPDSLDMLRYWVRERHLSGMRIFAGGSTVSEAPWLSASSLDPFWAAAADLPVPLHIQIRFGDTARVGVIAVRHPGLTIVIDNLALPPIEAGPPYEDAKALFDLAQFPNVFLKFTTSNLEAAAAAPGSPRTFIAALVARFGAQRMMWGSNFPTARSSGPAPYSQMVAAAKDAVAECSEDDQRAILGGTALMLYPLFKGAHR